MEHKLLRAWLYSSCVEPETVRRSHKGVSNVLQTFYYKDRQTSRPALGHVEQYGHVEGPCGTVSVVIHTT